MENSMKFLRKKNFSTLSDGDLTSARRVLAIACLLVSSLSFAQSTSFYGYDTNIAPSTNYSVPVGRSYFTTTVEPTAEGAKLIVDIYHGKLNSPVSLSLQAAVNDGSGKFEAIPFLELDKDVKDNPTDYHSRREFNLTYAELNAKFSKLLPPGASQLVIGPGTPLFVFSHFTDYNHLWGSVGRGGIFFMPEDPKGSTATNLSSVQARRPTEFEVAYPISNTMILKYNDVATKSGLKPGGEIGSHVEAEGKFQIPVEETETVKKRLFEISNSSSEVAKIFGPDWTLTPNLRYMLKDAAGKHILDKNGLPTPDPMVDTYYDNKNYDAAKKDVNIRYRMTEQNGIGKWGLKPGMGKDLGNGIQRRVEYALDATDSKPETIRAFADSVDPLNPFRAIREAIPGATPSDFLLPSVKVTDTRFKFELKHKNGLTIEVSLDQVEVDSLRSKIPSVKYTQLEMDIGHASTSATSGKAVATSGGAYTPTVSPEQTKFLQSLGSAAILDGRPVMHSIQDLEETAPVQAKNKADILLATTAIESLRDNVLGKNWLPGAQKGSLAATALGLVSEKDSSASVKKLFAEKARLANQGIAGNMNILVTSGAVVGGSCGNAFGN
jgi:hypothetical protein